MRAPIIVATLTYIRREGKTLMLHRNKKERDFHEGKYNGIGGKLEQSESPEICARREIFEETGLTANRLIYRGHLTFPRFDGENDWLCFVYECFDFSGDLVECDEGSLHWISDEDLFQLNLWEGDHHFLRVIYESSNLFSGVFTYENKGLTGYTLEVSKG